MLVAAYTAHLVQEKAEEIEQEISGIRNDIMLLYRRVRGNLVDRETVLRVKIYGSYYIQTKLILITI